MKPTQKIVLSIATFSLLTTSLIADEITLDPIVVNSDFRTKKLSKTTNTVTVIGEDKLYDKSSESFIETLGTSANVNFTSGASKAKYIQIRGIGERSQFEAPINPSVGLIVDGIDFSHNALGISLFDVKQIEVLRGPQGTTFGANGMAGVITVKSNEPTNETTGHLELTGGNYNKQAFGMAVGGTLLKETLLGRISLYKNKSDGFIENNFLNREDTNGIDELSGKMQLRWLVTDAMVIDMNYIHTDINNGYDAFTLDNSRISSSDNVGEDSQKNDALSLRVSYQFSDILHMVSRMSYSKLDSIYSYDEDWSYVGEFSDDLYPYNYFDKYSRDTKEKDFDIRVLSDENGRIFGGSTDWTFGIYAKQYDETLNRNRTKEGVDTLTSYNQLTDNRAVYGQLDTKLTPSLSLLSAIRVEQWKASYDNSIPEVLEKDEILIGGKLGINYIYSRHNISYITLSKGYKPGGVNADEVPTKEYKTENLWNVDIGLNSNYFDKKLTNRLNLFYGKRENQQVKLYQDEVKNFKNYLSNAEKGSYYGLEEQINYLATENLSLYGSLGLLRSTFDEFSLNVSQEDRTPSQSPYYQYNLGLQYQVADYVTFKSNLSRKGSYYFSNTHNQKSNAYSLLNASLEYYYNNWSMNFWAKNMLDTSYETRGFFFGNNPAKGYESELFIQQGDPRTFGVTLSYDF